MQQTAKEATNSLTPPIAHAITRVIPDLIRGKSCSEVVRGEKGLNLECVLIRWNLPSPWGGVGGGGSATARRQPPIPTVVAAQRLRLPQGEGLLWFNPIGTDSSESPSRTTTATPSILQDGVSACGFNASSGRTGIVANLARRRLSPTDFLQGVILPCWPDHARPRLQPTGTHRIPALTAQFCRGGHSFFRTVSTVSIRPGRDPRPLAFLCPAP